MTELKLTPFMPSETTIKQQIKQYLDMHSIFNFHIYNTLGSYKGSPDKIFIYKGVTVYCEIKKPNGKQSEYQKQFQVDVERSGGKYLLAFKVEDVIACIEEIKNGVKG